MTDTKSGGIYFSLLHLILLSISLTLIWTLGTHAFEAPKPSSYSFFLWLLWIFRDVYPTIWLIATRKRIPPNPAESVLQALTESWSDIISGSITNFNILRIWRFVVFEFIWKHLEQFDPSDFSIVFLWMFAIIWTGIFSVVVLGLMVLVFKLVSKTRRGMLLKLERLKDGDLEGASATIRSEGHEYAEKLLPLAGGIDDPEQLVKVEEE